MATVPATTAAAVSAVCRDATGNAWQSWFRRVDNSVQLWSAGGTTSGAWPVHLHARRGQSDDLLACSGSTGQDIRTHDDRLSSSVSLAQRQEVSAPTSAMLQPPAATSLSIHGSCADGPVSGQHSVAHET